MYTVNNLSSCDVDNIYQLEDSENTQGLLNRTLRKTTHPTYQGRNDIKTAGAINHIFLLQNLTLKRVLGSSASKFLFVICLIRLFFFHLIGNQNIFFRKKLKPPLK